MKLNNKVMKKLMLLIILSTCILTACSNSEENDLRKSDNSTSAEKPKKIANKKSTDGNSDKTVSPTAGSERITTEPVKDGISIKYVGNSCFYITFPDGTRLVTDPYGKPFESDFGKFPKMEADVITISHGHHDHTDGITAVSGKPKIINSDEINKSIIVGKVKIKGYNTLHVAYMGFNTVFVYQYGDIKIVNMGETDHIKSKEAINAVKNADIILAYAGEYGDIKNKDSFKTLYKLGIKVIIPEHYSNDPKCLYYGEPTIDDILKEVPKDIKVTNSKEFLVSKDLKKQFVNLTQWNK